MTPARPAPSFGLAVLLTTLVALGPISTDLYLPSLPTLARVFVTDAAQVQLTLSVFLAGFACAQLAYGPVSDRYGRRPALLGGVALYLVGSIGCMAAGSIEMLIAARFVQALGACSGPVVARAVVRDVWGGTEAARIIAYLGGAMAIAPLLGPTLGGFLTVWFGWRANFAFLALFSAIQLLAVYALLSESNLHRDPLAIHPLSMMRNFAALLRDRNYSGYLLCIAFSYSALFAFISGSSFVLIDRHGLSPQAYGMSFGIVVLGYMAGTFASGRTVRRFGSDRLLLAGALTGAVAGLSMWMLALARIETVGALLAPMFFCTLAAGLVIPNAIGSALHPYPKMAGAASALMGFGQMAIAALVGIPVGHGVAADPQALPMAVALATAAVPAAYFILVRKAAPPAP